MDTETVQKLFIQAYNQLMRNRSQVSRDCEEWRRMLTDFTDLNTEIARQEEEAQIVAELVKAAGKENASSAQSQEAYTQKYKALTRRYEAAAAELDRLHGIRELKSQQDKQMALFIRTLKRQPNQMDSWNDTIWTVMVEKAIVHKDGSITFMFYNGRSVTVR